MLKCSWWRFSGCGAVLRYTESYNSQWRRCPDLTLRNSQVERRISHLQDLVREGVRGRASKGFKLARVVTCKLRSVSVQSIRKVNWPNVRYHCKEGGTLLWAAQVKDIFWGVIEIMKRLWCMMTVPFLFWMFYFWQDIKSLHKTDVDHGPY